MRSTVCRRPNNQPITTTILCGIGDKHEPINGDNTQPLSLESTLRTLGLSKYVDSIRRNVIKTSDNVMQRLIDYEDQLTVDERGGIGAQTDVIGIYYAALLLSCKVTYIIVRLFLYEFCFVPDGFPHIDV